MQNVEEIMNEIYQLRADKLEAEEMYKAGYDAARLKLARIVTEKREKIGVSQQQASCLLGKPKPFFWQVENPDKVPNPYAVDSFLEALNSLDKLAALAHLLPIATKK